MEEREAARAVEAWEAEAWEAEAWEAEAREAEARRRSRRRARRKRMTRPHTIRRPGFTLLEVLLASALAVVLMAALYVALDVQLRLAAAGRESLDETTLTRAIVHRLETDLSSVMGPVAPPTGNSGGMGGGSGMGDMSGAGGMTGAMDPTQSAAISFQAGVIGESDGDDRPRLTMFVAKIASLGGLATESPDGANPADVRRVTYWMTDWGLARQELPWVTSQDLQNSTEPLIEDGKEERDYVIAEEVASMTIEYWDGTQWTESWDGRTLNSDGATMMGPPMAIRVRFTLNLPGEHPGETIQKEFWHTIAVRSAPGPAIPDAMAAAMDMGTTTSMP